MRRSLIIVALAVLAGGAVFFAAWRTAARVCTACVQPADELGWLRTEFNLSEAQMQAVRKLHEGYLPKCHELCRQIEAKRAELDARLDGSTNITDDARQRIAEIAALRARCQTQMLDHFYEVSRAMPPEQGKRYLAEMCRLTMGEHARTEEQMTDSDAPANGHHH